MNATLTITALNHNTIEVSLPDGIGNAFPTIPTALHGRRVPEFVLQWLLETDEVGFMIQETLQAPTRSMCRIYKIPPQENNPKKSNPKEIRGKDKIGGKMKQPLTPIIKSPAKGIKKGDLKGHSAEQDVVELSGLPKGIRLPASLEHNSNVPDRVKEWIEQGKKVQQWLIEEGLEESSWLPQ